MKKIIIFGASGDLAKRKIIPSLSKVVQDDITVYGYARSDLKKVYPSKLREFYSYTDDFPEKIIYIKGEYNDISPLKDILDAETIIYFSTPPILYPILLGELSKYMYSSICLEKPFGNTYEDFKILQQYTNKNITFIDHYLLKPLMVSIYQIQMKNKELFNLLNYRHISSVKCHFFEKILAEGRQFFDQTGIIKDVMQNHLIEIVATLLCKKPTKEFSEQRLSVIRSMQIDNSNVVFGQYKSYCNEMKTQSKTETFASFRCVVALEEWKNVNFYMAAGKGLNIKASEIIFLIKRESYGVFINIIKANGNEIDDKNNIGTMSLVFNIAPHSEVYITFKTPKGSYKYVIISTDQIQKLVDEEFDGRMDYEAVFHSLITGSFLPAISFSEAAELWRIFNPIILHEKHLIYYEANKEYPKGVEE